MATPSEQKNFDPSVIDIYDRSLKARLPVQVQDGSAIRARDMARIDAYNRQNGGVPATPSGVFNMWTLYNGNGIKGNPQRWFDGVFNPTNDPRLSNNFASIDAARNKARAKYWGSTYKPGKVFSFKYDVSPDQYVPIDKQFKPQNLIRYATSNTSNKGFASSNNWLGLISPGKRIIFHEGIPITGHAYTIGNLYGGTNHPNNYMFSSAPHGQQGNTRFHDWLKRHGSWWVSYGNNTPGSYYNSIPELTGLLNRLKTQSAFTTTPWTTLNFNMDDPKRKAVKAPDGTYDLQDYIINSGMATWDAKNNKFIPNFSVAWDDKRGNYIIHNSRPGSVIDKAWMTNGIRPSKMPEDRFRTLKDDSFSLADPLERLALIHQLNRVYHLKGLRRSGKITPQQSKELDRVLDLYPKYAEQANNTNKRIDKLNSGSRRNKSVVV